MESALAATEAYLTAKAIANRSDKETKMPRGRRPKATPAPKKFERQEALKNRIVGLSEELARVDLPTCYSARAHQAGGAGSGG